GGPDDTFDWDDEGRWSNGLPGAGDTAVIAGSGQKIKLLADVAVAELFASGVRIDARGHKLTVGTFETTGIVTLQEGNFQIGTNARVKSGILTVKDTDPMEHPTALGSPMGAEMSVGITDT